MPFFLSPIGNSQTFDANGDPLNAGQIETYLAGSSTPAATYTDYTGGTPQSNPIILNSLGYAPNPIWLTGGVSYKFVIKNAAGVIQRTVDNISGVNDASVSQSEWVVSGFTPTYINATSFSVPGDQTMVLQINRRLRTTNTSGLIYSTITNSVFADGITTVTVVNDSGSLDGGLTTVEYALLSASPLSVPSLPFSKITGTVPIAQGGTGQTTAAAAFNALKQDATDAVTGVVELATTAEAQAGTDAIRVITPARLRDGLNASGSAPIYACRAWVNFDGTGTVAIRASGNVSSITDNGVGLYTINFITDMPDVNYAVFGMSMLNRIVQYPSSTFGTGVQIVGAVSIRVSDFAGAAQDDQCVNVAIFR